MASCKITVLRKMINRDFVNEYSSLDLSDQCLGCHLLTVGQEFLVEDHNSIPEGFCAWAWGDIQKDVTHIMFDGSYPWMKKPGTAISSCSDGLMPVIFKIEKLNETSPEI